MMLLMAGGIGHAHDFVVTINGQKVYFNIKSAKNKTAEVTYNGSISNGQPTYFEGELTVPAKVKHDNVVYSVVGVSAKAFCGADKLTGIILPSGIVSIGDFAFEGCSSLRKVLFPGNEVKFGQGVFFKCDKIQDVSFGSDWKDVDFRMFRWSDSLKTVAIPAKMEKINNFKSLKNLASISVDVNNSRFSAIDGILYNKKGDVLYGCPRAYQGKVRIADGTATITAGALADCKAVTGIVCPESLKSLSFREFANLSTLEMIVFKGIEPVKTAKRGGEELFLLQVAAPNVKIVVLKSAKNLYKALLVRHSGEYTEMEGSAPYYVEQSKMPDTKNIVGVKDFSKYE